MSDDFISKLEKTVECHICHNRLEDPRLLPCDHTYCRFCLDDLLEFHENGKASIKCPLDCCDGEIEFGTNETTKNLPKNLALNNIMVLIQELNERY